MFSRLELLSDNTVVRSPANTDIEDILNKKQQISVNGIVLELEFLSIFTRSIIFTSPQFDMSDFDVYVTNVHTPR